MALIRSIARRKQTLLVALGMLIALGAIGAVRCGVAGRGETSWPLISVQEPRKPFDVTFIVASDTHLGLGDPVTPGRDPVKNPVRIEKTNLQMIDAMNSVAGKLWPQQLGGAVSEPRGVLISGDLTENGGKQDWVLFEALYGRTGKEGPLRYPVYEGDGNHDAHRGWFIREEIARRHGGRRYSFDFEGLHLVCLGEAPDEDGLEFLEKDLKQLAPDTPVVLYFHFPLLGPYSDTWFTRGGYPEQLYRVIQGYRVIAIFHGHYHASGGYHWRGYDVYNVGSPKHDHHSFAVVNVTNEHMRVASWNYDLQDWWWWHGKSIALDEPTGAEGQPKPPPTEVLGIKLELEEVVPRVDL